MGKQSNNITAAEITKIISSSISSIANNVSVAYASTNVNIQSSIGNTGGCTQILHSNLESAMYFNSAIMASSSTYQSVVASIVNQLQASQTNTTTGKLLQPGQYNNVSAEILNMIVTQMTAKTMNDIFASSQSVASNSQLCADNSGPTLQIIWSNTQTFTDQVSSLVSNNSSVQQVSADISNFLSASQANKSTGILAVLARLVMMVIVVIIIVIGIVVLIGGVILLKMYT